MRDPLTDTEWQDAVDAAHGALALQSARRYGLVTGGPVVYAMRCTKILEEGKRKGFVPAADAVERFVAGHERTRRFRGILAVEGQSTNDGRLIAEGALSWPEEGVPLLLGFGGPVVGRVESIERDGQTIRCEGTVEDGALFPGEGEFVAQPDAPGRFGLAIGVRITESDLVYDSSISRGEFSLDRGEIYEAAVTAQPAFPDATAEFDA